MRVVSLKTLKVGEVVEHLLLGEGLRGVVQSALRRVGVQATLVLVGIHSTSFHMNTYSYIYYK